MRRTYFVVALVTVAVAALLGYAVAQNLGRPAPAPKTLVSGTVTSLQPNSNFSLIFFNDSRTGVTYGAAVTTANTTTLTTCMKAPCVYSITLFSNDQYSTAILVETTSFGGQVCPGTPSLFTPTGQTFHQDFRCNTQY